MLFIHFFDCFSKERRHVRLFSQTLLSLLFLTQTLMFAGEIHAAEITLAWDPNTETNLAGYRIYYGTNVRNYENSVDVGKVTSHTITNLGDHDVYHFAATAYNTEDQESDYSEEVVYDTGQLDSDSDGIANYDEIYIYGTDPSNSDTDGDEINDGKETAYWGTNWDGDHDADGIINILDPDSDDDGFLDGFEIANNYDPSNRNSRPSSAPPTVYEDAKDGNTKGWSIYDTTPAGASFSNVFDQTSQSNAIQFSGASTANGYRLRKQDGSKWQNTSQFVIEWSMKYSEAFTVYIDLETTAGHRYVYYTAAESDRLGSGRYVHYGLGANAVNGEWQTFTRDLQADLQAAQPGVVIQEVNGFLIRGSGRVNNIKLHDQIPKTQASVYEDAKDGNTKGWSIYDNKPARATISNVFDQTSQSHVIQFSGSGKRNGYRLRKEDGSKWQNTNQFVIEWSMKYSEAFVVYIDLKTTAGHRLVYYTAAESDRLGSGRRVHHGLGANAVNGEWQTFTRDLQADLQAAQPGVLIQEVNGFLIRGSGRINNIKLHGQLP